MDSLLHSTHPLILFVVVFLAILVFAWLLLARSPKQPGKRRANWMDSSESGFDVSEGRLYSTAAQCSTEPATSPQQADSAPAANTSVTGSSSDAVPDPFGIVSEVCSLSSPTRESVEESYQGRRVRWTLCLSAIAEREREGQGAAHVVRMYPSGRSPQSCGVYFEAKPEDYAVLQAAGQNAAFVVEGTIAKVEDRDIDLTDVRMISIAAA